MCLELEAGFKLWSGRALLSVNRDIPYDNTKSLRIKESDGSYVRYIYAEAPFILTKISEKSLL